MKRSNFGFVLADGVCPICFVNDNRHVEGCRRGVSSEEITRMVERLPTVDQRPTPRVPEGTPS